MTQLPHDNWNVKERDDLPKYKVGPRCCHPDCNFLADHAHHLWRRSFGTRGAWVELVFLDPPVIVGNLVPLCWRHHEDVTVNKARIEYLDTTDLFVWRVGDAVAEPLKPQPPRWADQLLQTHVHDENEDVCSKCGRRRKTKDEMPPGEKRARKSWTIKVPDDAEDGADILDTLCDELADLFAMDHYTSQLQRYYVCAQAFALVLQNKEMIASA